MQGVQSVPSSSCQWNLREGWHSWVSMSWFEDGLVFFELVGEEGDGLCAHPVLPALKTLKGAV